MAQFPTTLPPPTIEGYQLAPLDQTIRTDMEVGAPRARRRTAARLDRMTVRWVLTDGQMETFRVWVEDPAGAAGGAAWFILPLAAGFGGLDTVEARIVQWRAGALTGLLWEVFAELEARPQ